VSRERIGAGCHTPFAVGVAAGTEVAAGGGGRQRATGACSSTGREAGLGERHSHQQMLLAHSYDQYVPCATVPITERRP